MRCDRGGAIVPTLVFPPCAASIADVGARGADWRRAHVSGPRARTYVREVDDAAGIRDHSDMPAFPRCAALLRNGQPCGRTAAAGSEFCVHHTKLLETVDPESLRQGRIPKKRALRDSPLRLIPPSHPVDRM